MYIQREREKERETETDRDRDRDRQTDRDRQRQRQTDRKTVKQRQTDIDRQRVCVSNDYYYAIFNAKRQQPPRTKRTHRNLYLNPWPAPLENNNCQIIVNFPIDGNTQMFKLKQHSKITFPYVFHSNDIIVPSMVIHFQLARVGFNNG